MGWIANVLIIIGLYLIGNKVRHAFLFSIAGEMIWAARASLNHDWELASICCVFCVMATRNWFRWRPTHAS